ncbi:MAG: hypothetical protein Q8M15_03030 [Bacteroidota bacterium]|nr:hypothetical protein [Bacteroidota bacterium]
MKDFIIFPPNTINQYLEKLNQDTVALWGTMSAQHMLEHLLLVLEISRGKFEVSIITPIEKVEKVKRIFLLGDSPLKKDFNAPFLPEGLQPLLFGSIEEAKKGLLLEVETYLHFWQNNPQSKFSHPVFGVLSANEWHLFHRKHFTHHFNQFGLL